MPETKTNSSDGLIENWDVTYPDWKAREEKYKREFTDERWVRTVEKKTTRWMELQIRRGHELNAIDSANAWKKLDENMRRGNSQLQLCRTGRCGRGRRLDVLIGQVDG